jgi:hypothetical protein
MKNILFIHPGQFGSQTSTYNYCLLLKDSYNIKYIGFDDGLKNMNLEGINYIHLSHSRNMLTNRIMFFKTIYNELKKTKYDFILVNYFIFCSVLSFLVKKKGVIEIRSGYIYSSSIKRFIYNTILFIEVRFFKNITTISSGIVKYLRLPKRTHILPLGSKLSLPIKKDFESLRVLYVGTFHERNINKTIHAFAKFYKEYNCKININYTIIGFGSKTEINNILNTIKILEMNDHVIYKGTIRSPLLDPYLKEHNIGMSYIPIKKHFENQPPFKTYEYLLNGLTVLATATKENKKVVTKQNGVLVGDSICDVYEGLVQIYKNRQCYNSLIIQKKAQQYSWDSIVNKNLIPYIEKI